MSDPISLVGLVGSILQFIDTIVKARDYVSGYKNAPKDQRDFLAEVDGLPPLLWELTTRLRTDKSVGVVNGIQQFETPLIRLEEIMSEMQKKLGPKHGVAKVFDRLVWPLWGEKEVKKGLDAIERFKVLFGMWLAIGFWEAQSKTHRAVVLSHETTALQQEEVKSTILHSVGSVRSAVLQSVESSASEVKREISTTLATVVEQQERDRTLFESLRGTTQKLAAFHDDEKRDQLIEWWSPINFFTRQQDIFNTQQPGTGGWFLSSDPFKAWMLGLGTKLWCPGIPGAGKTVLVSTIVHHLRETLWLPESTGVAVIYLNHKEREIQLPANLLASIWRQLVLGRAISMEVHTIYQKHREQRTRPSLEDSRRVLLSTIAEYSKVLLLIDAVDEYPEDNRRTLLKNLCNLGTNVNLMLTSRPHINLSSLFDNPQTLVIQAAAEDIQQYVNAAIDDSPRLSRHVKDRPELRQEIETFSIDHSKGMFLLTKLHISAIKTKHTIRAVREALKQMPTDLHSTYNEVMLRINQQSEDDKNLARSALAWVSNAKRLLRVSELREALAVEPDTSEVDPDNLLDMDFVLAVCAGLVIIDTADDVVRLVHYTAQDYLDHTQEIHFPTAQIEITTSCITYLSFTTFVGNTTSVSLSRMSNLIRDHPLLDYAVDYALIHARQKPEHLIRETLLLFLGHAGRNWINVWASRRRASAILRSLWTSRLSIAAFFDLRETARHLISVQEETVDVNAALQVAAANAHKEMIDLLIANGADVNRRGKYNGSAIQVAAHVGCEETVTFLLSKGANVNAQGGDYGTALQAAAVRGHAAVVRLLLEHGADANITKGGQFRTAVQAAFELEYYDIVQLLLTHGADINEQEGYDMLQTASRMGKHEMIRLVLGRNGYRYVALKLGSKQELEKVARLSLKNRGSNISPLHAAFSQGQKDDVRTLLALGADTNTRDKNGTTPLHIAAMWGNEEVVTMLLRNNADVNAQSNFVGGTALRIAVAKGYTNVAQTLIQSGADINACHLEFHVAVRKGHSDMVQLLLQNGTNVNVRDHDGNTALLGASVDGNENVAQILLENGADVSVCNQEGETALHVASRRGDGNVAHLLLENGADVNARDHNDVTALLGASVYGHENVAQILLENGADVNACNQEGETALHVASRRGDGDVIHLLLENGADVNARDHKGNTALLRASIEGHINVAQILLENAADFNAWSQQGESALHVVSRKGHSDIVQLLLEHGADSNVWDNNLKITPLLAASANGQENVARILLLHGADLSVRNPDDETALHVASRKGHSDVVELLLKHGADINASDNIKFSYVTPVNNYLTPWLRASLSGQKNVVQIFLEHGADVSVRSRSGETALHLASRIAHVDVVELLLENGADIDARDNKNFTPFLGASLGGNKNVVQIFLDHGADATARSRNGETALHLASRKEHVDVIQLLLENGADVNARDNNGFTALLGASLSGCKKAVEILIQNGADINMQIQGETALLLASRIPHVDVVELLLESGADANAHRMGDATVLQMTSKWGFEEVVQLLIKNGANVNEGDWLQGTALHAACQGGHKKIVQLLLKNRANVNAVCLSGTAIEVATRLGHEKVVQLLLDNGAYGEDGDVARISPTNGTDTKLGSESGHRE